MIDFLLMGFDDLSGNIDEFSVVSANCKVLKRTKKFGACKFDKLRFLLCRSVH